MLRWVCPALALCTATAAWAKFERPSENDRLAALGNLFEEPEVLRRLLKPDSDFLPITPPGPTDWLLLHNEAGESFDAYRDSTANRPDAIPVPARRLHRGPSSPPCHVVTKSSTTGLTSRSKSSYAILITSVCVPALKTISGSSARFAVT